MLKFGDVIEGERGERLMILHRRQIAYARDPDYVALCLKVDRPSDPGWCPVYTEGLPFVIEGRWLPSFRLI